MKKYFKSFLFVLFFAFLFASCDLLNLTGFYSENNSGQTLVTPTKSQTWTYNETYPIVKVDPDIASLKINNIPSNKQIFIITRNAGSTEISRSATQNNERLIFENELSDLISEDFFSENEKFDCVLGPDLSSIKVEVKQNLSRAASSQDSSSNLSYPKEWQIDDTKTIQFASDETGSYEYSQKNCTLKAIGQNCYFWIENSVFESGEVTTVHAEDYQQSFDEIYQMERFVFGKESDYLSTFETYKDSTTNEYFPKTSPMSKYCDTGTFVNIVACEFPESYSNVVGFVFSADYYYTNLDETDSLYQQYEEDFDLVKNSNHGKYFYINKDYIVKDSADIKSTMIHEFQHLINLNQKSGLGEKTSFNEMLSMLAEDMFAEFLYGKNYDETTISPFARIKTFLVNYFASGITGWESSDSRLSASYANAYTFGSWIARQYGGAALVKEISQNEYVNEESLVQAVNSVNGTNFTFDDLFEQFLLAIMGNETYTMNQNAAQNLIYSANSYPYPMKALDIYGSLSDKIYAELKYDSTSNFYKAKDENFNWKGPFVLSGKLKTICADNGICITGSSLTNYLLSNSYKTYRLTSERYENEYYYFVIR